MICPVKPLGLDQVKGRTQKSLLQMHLGEAQG